MMLKGMTTQFLFRRTPCRWPKATRCCSAAAGGVGLIACQWAASEGITLIGTADRMRNAARTGKRGDPLHQLHDRGLPSRVRELTGGKGVDAVMDSVGASTFDGSLNCLKPFGMMISFGNASGKVPPFDILQLSAKGSLKLTRPTLFSHIADPATCQQMAAELFARSRRCREDPHRAALPARARGRGPPRARGARHHRLHHLTI